MTGLLGIEIPSLRRQAFESKNKVRIALKANISYNVVYERET